MPYDHLQDAVRAIFFLPNGTAMLLTTVYIRLAKARVLVDAVRQRHSMNVMNTEVLKR